MKMEGSVLGATLGSFFISLLYTPFPLYEEGNYGIRQYYSLKVTDAQYEVYEEYSPFIKSRGTFNYTIFLTNKDEEEIEEIAPVLEEQQIEDIYIQRDSIFIDFKNKPTRSFILSKTKNYENKTD